MAHKRAERKEAAFSGRLGEGCSTTNEHRERGSVPFALPFPSHFWSSNTTRFNISPGNKTCCFVKICWRQRQQVWKADLVSHWGGKSIRIELDPNKRESWCDPGALKGSQRLVFLHSTMQRSATGSPGDPVCVWVGLMKLRLTSSKLKAILSYIKY